MVQRIGSTNKSSRNDSRPINSGLWSRKNAPVARANIFQSSGRFAFYSFLFHAARVFYLGEQCVRVVLVYARGRGYRDQSARRLFRILFWSEPLITRWPLASSDVPQLESPGLCHIFVAPHAFRVKLVTLTFSLTSAFSGGPYLCICL